jgi:hypothetical protein
MKHWLLFAAAAGLSLTAAAILVHQDAACLPRPSCRRIMPFGSLVTRSCCGWVPAVARPGGVCGHRHQSGCPGRHDLPCAAYRGPEPYLFVSYAHRDAAAVYAEVARLHGLGYRLWYDEGIEPGQEWPEAIAAALGGCAFFLVFLSPRAVASRNVRNEIYFALEEDKPFLAVHLEPTELTGGMRLQIGSLQAILKHALPEEHYQRRLQQTLPPRLCDGH